MLYFERWKVVLIVLLCFAGLAYSAPNFIPRASLENVPGWLPSKQVNLGLDLRGGSYMLLGLDTSGLEQSRLQDLVNEVRNALRDVRVPYTGLGIQGGIVTVNITNADDVEKAREAVDGLASTVPANVMSGLPEPLLPGILCHFFPESAEFAGFGQDNFQQTPVFRHFY